APGASAGSPYNVTVTAYDNTNAVSTTFTLTVGLSQGGPQVILCSADTALAAAADTTQPPWSWEEGALLNPRYWVNQLDLQAGTFIIRRDSDLSAPLTVYFQFDSYNPQLNGSADCLDDYTATFGPGGGYVDDSTGQGYVVIPAGEADATVTTLDVSRTKITDDGLKSMATMPALQVLNLSGTATCDAGLQALIDHAATPHPRSINLADTRVSDKGMERLRKAFPQAQIEYGPKGSRSPKP
ncbi:MAG: hypothetical protein ACP5XB_30950, partial [Isosphaeraceae bacterium]